MFGFEIFEGQKESYPQQFNYSFKYEPKLLKNKVFTRFENFQKFVAKARISLVWMSMTFNMDTGAKVVFVKLGRFTITYEKTESFTYLLWQLQGVKHGQNQQFAPHRFTSQTRHAITPHFFVKFD